MNIVVERIKGLVLVSIAVGALLSHALWHNVHDHHATTAAEVTPPAETSQPTAFPSPGGTETIPVSITAAGFSPKSVILHVGDIIVFTNNDATYHEVVSDPHPTHLDYPPLNGATLKKEEEHAVTFTKVGRFTYHDHLHPELRGIVEVQP